MITLIRDSRALTLPEKVDTAIEVMQSNCPPEGFHLGFSGGKDSQVLLMLAEMAGVLYDAHFNLTTVDPPEVLRFTREHYPQVSLDKPAISMWKLIVKKGMPPTRIVRYCCQYLKEVGGIGRVCLMGLRWEESEARKKRKIVETCKNHPSKSFVNPIIDWTARDVWQFIRENNMPYCALYDEGFERIGCVMCPLASHKNRWREVRRFPKFYKAYMRTFGKMLEAKWAAGKDTGNWRTAEDVMRWWLQKKKPDERQLLFTIFD